MLEFLTSQLKQVKQGGRPVLVRKVVGLVSGLVAVPVVLLIYLLHPKGVVEPRRLIAEIKRAIERAWQEAATEAAAILKRGRSLQNSDAVDQAMDCYRRAITLQPDSPHGYFALADGYYLKGQYSEKIAAYKRGMELLAATATQQGLHRAGIRFIGPEWTASIGHISLLDPLVKLMMLDRLSPHKRVLVTAASQIANRCYLEYWRRHIPIVILDDAQYQSFQRLAEPLAEHLSMWLLSDGFADLYAGIDQAEKSWSAQARAPLLSLSPQDTERGWQVLQKLGVARDAWFVGLHVREGESRAARSGADADIYSYLPAIRSITSRGGWVVRMGNSRMKPLPDMPQVVDYVHCGVQSDWMDVFLWASCRFFIGSASGPVNVPATFGVPAIYTNAPALGIVISLKDAIVLPKLYWSESQKRLLTFSEMFASPVGWSVSRDLVALGLKPVDNTPEEINNAVLEMLARVEDNGVYTQEDRQAQDRLNFLRAKHGAFGMNPIARDFAREHSALLH